MNSIEEKLWNYIDGTCPPDEQQAIARLIESDEVYSLKYNELLMLNAEFAAIKLDEPPMAFTYNVMETIRTEHALTPLKAAIDVRVIRGIGLFFVCTIAALLIYALSSIQWSAGSGSVSLPDSFVLPMVNISPALLKGFLFFDTVLALFIIDSYLRKKRGAKTQMSVQNGVQQKEH